TRSRRTLRLKGGCPDASTEAPAIAVALAPRPAVATAALRGALRHLLRHPERGEPCHLRVRLRRVALLRLRDRPRPVDPRAVRPAAPGGSRGPAERQADAAARRAL